MSSFPLVLVNFLIAQGFFFFFFFFFFFVVVVVDVHCFKLVLNQLNNGKINFQQGCYSVTFLNVIVYTDAFYWESRLKLTYFSPVLHFISKPVIWLGLQIKWLVSIWNATMGWKELRRALATYDFCRYSFDFGMCWQNWSAYPNHVVLDYKGDCAG